MSGRYSSFVLKPKRSTSSGEGKAKSSPNSTSSATTSNVGIISNTFRSRTSKNSAPEKGILKTAAKLPRTLSTTAKKSTPTLPASNPAISVLSSTSDDLSKALVLRRRTFTKSSTSTVQNSNSKITPASKMSSDNLELIKGTNSQTPLYFRDTVNPSSVGMHNEGPIDIPEENFDFYKILSRPNAWDGGEEEDANSGSSSVNEIKIPASTITSTAVPIKSVPTTTVEKEELNSNAHALSTQSCELVKSRESEIWGEMRASTAEEESSSSHPPSLTCIVEDEKKKCCVIEDEEKGNEEETIRDENNNVLETIKNTIYRSLTFFEASRSCTNTITDYVDDKSGRGESKEAVVNYDKENSGGSFSTSKELDQVNGSEGKINAQAYSGNIHNSPTPLGVSLPGPGTSTDSILIPLNVRTQLQTAFHSNSGSVSVESLQQYCTRQLQNLSRLETANKKGEEVQVWDSSSEAEPPSLTKMRHSVGEIKDSSSLQLFLNGEKLCETETSRIPDAQSSIMCTSPTSSYTSAVSDEEFHYADTAVQHSEETDSQQTQTQRLASNDAETDTEDAVRGNKKEKLMSLVMTVNSGVEIPPSPEEKRNQAMRLRSIMKVWRPEGVHIDGTLSKKSVEFLAQLTDQKIRRLTIPDRIKCPGTFSQVGADYGFPADISISRIIEKLATITWYTNGDYEEDDADTYENNILCQVANITAFFGGEGSRLMEAAFGMLNAGLKYATDLIGVEAELEPREDLIRYCGYKIRVHGRRLLLESLHVNCDFNNIFSNGICCRSNHSVMCSNQMSWSRTKLEESFEGKRIRIVVRIIGPVVEGTESCSSGTALQYNVCNSDGKWTFIFGNGKDRDNFIEIGCPNGVHPDSLAYGVLNGLLLVDAP